MSWKENGCFLCFLWLLLFLLVLSLSQITFFSIHEEEDPLSKHCVKCCINKTTRFSCYFQSGIKTHQFKGRHLKKISMNLKSFQKYILVLSFLNRYWQPLNTPFLWKGKERKEERTEGWQEGRKQTDKP